MGLSIVALGTCAVATYCIIVQLLNTLHRIHNRSNNSNSSWILYAFNNNPANASVGMDTLVYYRYTAKFPKEQPTEKELPKFFWQNFRMARHCTRVYAGLHDEIPGFVLVVDKEDGVFVKTTVSTESLLYTLFRWTLYLDYTSILKYHHHFRSTTRTSKLAESLD